MNSPAVKESTSWLLLKISLQAKKELIRIAEEYDLSVMQLYTVLFLEDHVQVPMHSISTILSCDPSNVTGIVDKLVGASYLERAENPTDRRVKTIMLTEKGLALREEIVTRIESSNALQLSNLSEHEKATLNTLLQKIAQ
ncbi:MAG: MarR family winged helix-turn-helix transcriptional regulator [Candidatus Pacebacteria bacterium]|nr:MarR family winged helix-turn-helix transcriptional regulator [Candidatus Paceibacterota bacterium]